MTYGTDHSARKHSGFRHGFAVVLVAAIGLAMSVARAAPGDSASSTDPATGVTTTSTSNPDGSHTVTRTDADGNEIPDGNGAPPETPAEQSDSGVEWRDDFEEWDPDSDTGGSDDTADSDEPAESEYGPDDATWPATARARVARAAAAAAWARYGRVRNELTWRAAFEAELRALEAKLEELEQRKQAAIRAAAEANRRNSVLRGLQAVQIQNTIRNTQRPHIPQMHRVPPVYRAPVETPRRVIILSVGPTRRR